MAKDNVIKFPTKSISMKARISTYQNRMDEIEIENQYMVDDIAYLGRALKKNKEEMAKILKEMAVINGEAGVYDPQAHFENEWGDYFEFTHDFEIDDPEED